MINPYSDHLLIFYYFIAHMSVKQIQLNKPYIHAQDCHHPYGHRTYGNFSIHNPVGICTTELLAELTEHVAASMSLCYVATGDHYD
jgi:hypothetical protein